MADDRIPAVNYCKTIYNLSLIHIFEVHGAENDRQYNIYLTLNDSANVSMNNIDSVIKQIADVYKRQGSIFVIMPVSIQSHHLVSQ